MPPVPDAAIRPAAAGATTRQRDPRLLIEAEAGFQEADALAAGERSFEEVFERACTDVQAMFLEDGKVPPHLILGLHDGPLVVLPFACDAEAERTRLFSYLAREYQGRTEFYVQVNQLWTPAASSRNENGRKTRAPIIILNGVDRAGITLARSWEAKEEPARHLIENGATYRDGNGLSGLLFPLAVGAGRRGSDSLEPALQRPRLSRRTK
jgi:hypothetical protein